MHRKHREKFFTTHDICLIGIFAAIIAVCAQLRIPLAVPFTMQTWAVMFAGIVLGTKNGVAAVLVYILLGFFGAPVFNGFTGGPGVVFGPTGGFILTFPVMAWAAGIARKKKVYILATVLVVAAIVNLSFGMVWFSLFTSHNLSNAFRFAVAPFLLPELFKIAAVITIGGGIRKALEKA